MRDSAPYLSLSRPGRCVSNDRPRWRCAAARAGSRTRPASNEGLASIVALISNGRKRKLFDPSGQLRTEGEPDCPPPSPILRRACQDDTRSITYSIIILYLVLQSSRYHAWRNAGVLPRDCPGRGSALSLGISTPFSTSAVCALACTQI